LSSLEGRVALVSGGARGIGAAIARLFAERGSQVLIGDVREGEGRSLAAELGASARFVPLDVTREADWAEAVAVAEAEFGALSILINNAGLLLTGSVTTTTADDFRHMIDVNLTGAFHGIAAAVPAMRRAGGGSIVNIGSAASIAGYAGLAAYVAAKHGLLGLTKAAALDLAADKIRVNALLPGQVTTPMTEGWSSTPRLTPMRRSSDPIEIARFAAFLASDEASYCTGGAFPADGGVTAGLVNGLPQSR
jgi:3alpha(or 20beta)-hydroxysteroid dehydrogenase